MAKDKNKNKNKNQTTNANLANKNIDTNFII